MLNIILALNMNHKDLGKMVEVRIIGIICLCFLTFLTKDYEAF